MLVGNFFALCVVLGLVVVLGATITLAVLAK
jgi:hypothetical protein